MLSPCEAARSVDRCLSIGQNKQKFLKTVQNINDLQKRKSNQMMACSQLLRPSPRALKLTEVIHTTLALEYVKWHIYNVMKSFATLSVIGNKV
jgi:hypothetical protein